MKEERFGVGESKEVGSNSRGAENLEMKDGVMDYLPGSLMSS